MGKNLAHWTQGQVLELCKCETPVTWKEWLEEKKSHEATFPCYQHCHRYALISRYPGAYKQGSTGRREANALKVKVGKMIAVSRCLPASQPKSRHEQVRSHDGTQYTSYATAAPDTMSGAELTDAGGCKPTQEIYRCHDGTGRNLLTLVSIIDDTNGHLAFGFCTLTQLGRTMRPNSPATPRPPLAPRRDQLRLYLRADIAGQQKNFANIAI